MEFLKYADYLSTNLVDKVKSSLDMAQLSPAILVLKRQKTDVGKFVQSVCDRYSVLVKAGGLKFVKRIERKLPELRFDPEKIEQVLNNILELAFQYASKHHTITLSVSASTQVAAEGEEDVILFSIEGLGRDIKKEELTHLLELLLTISSGHS